MSWYTVPEAASRLGVTRQAVQRLIDRGTLAATKEVERGRTKRWLVSADDVQARMQQARTVPEGWVTVPEAAEIRGRQPDTIRNWIADCGLPATRHVDGSWLIERTVLDSFPTPRPGPRGSRPEPADVL